MAAQAMVRAGNELSLSFSHSFIFTQFTPPVYTGSAAADSAAAGTLQVCVCSVVVVLFPNSANFFTLAAH